MTTNKKHLLNYSIFIPYLILSVLGLIIMYSATSANEVYFGRNPFFPVIKQGGYWLVSLLGIWFIYRLKLSFLREKWLLGLVMQVELLLLIATLFFGRAEDGNGATGWLHIGRLSLQGAEYLKLIMVWFLAFNFSNEKHKHEIEKSDYQGLMGKINFARQLNDWRNWFSLLLLLVIVQPDLGNATIIFLTAVIMYSLSGVSYRWFSVLMLGTFSVSAVFLSGMWLIGAKRLEKLPLFGHVAKRLIAFFNPFADVLDSGLQLAHSYYAISNGGWFGRGLGNSIEKNGYLPEAASDFIFSIVIEELGLIGAGLILALTFFLILRIIHVGLKAKDDFNALLALGIGALLFVQVFVNVGGISGLIPSTGVTYPFFSQGGNSLLTVSLAIGIVLNIDANEKRAALARQV